MVLYDMYWPNIGLLILSLKQPWASGDRASCVHIKWQVFKKSQFYFCDEYNFFPNIFVLLLVKRKLFVSFSTVSIKYCSRKISCTVPFSHSLEPYIAFLMIWKSRFEKYWSGQCLEWKKTERSSKFMNEQGETPKMPLYWFKVRNRMVTSGRNVLSA